MMKLLLIMTFLSSSFVYAFNDYDCSMKLPNGGKLKVIVEQAVFPGSTTRDLEVRITSNGRTTRKSYRNAWMRERGLNSIAFSSGAVNLEIDLWMTQGIPRYGNRYRSTFRSPDVNNGKETRKLNCSYYGVSRPYNDPFNPRDPLGPFDPWGR